LSVDRKQNEQKAGDIKRNDVKRLSGVTDGQGSKNVSPNKVPIVQIGETDAIASRQGDSV